MLKICFSKNLNFFGTKSIGGGGGGSDGFYQTKKIFLKTSHPYWSVPKKIRKNNEKHRRYGQKNLLCKKCKKKLIFIICNKLVPLAIGSNCKNTKNHTRAVKFV